MILDKKSIFVGFIAIVLLSLSLVTASAIEDKSDLITPKFSHIDVFQNEFDISASGKGGKNEIQIEIYYSFNPDIHDD